MCYELREREGCASLLQNPRRGESVLWVPYPARPGARLGVAAVDHHGRWLYAFGDQCTGAADVPGVAARIAWTVNGG
ncbi:hypothetical protein [Spirillospora albida]|uniref:hypothetical protein n=1 Tax=Spirillospora albida TaxID=58123 RepID=UPI0012FB76DF|nr:hypothetical protein [Spirillospora albida]